MKKQTPFLLITLTLIFAGQLMRVLFPSIGWYLRDTVKVGVTGLIPYALGPFLLGFIGLILVKKMKPRNLLLMAGGGLMLARLAEQFSIWPSVDLGLAMFGIVCFLWLLPLLVGFGTSPFVYGTLMGLALDTALKALTHTLDLSWISDVWATFIVALLVGIYWIVVYVAAKRPDVNGRSWRNSIPLLGFGLWLLLQWLIIYNQGWVTTLTGWSQPVALLLILLGSLGSFWVAAKLPHNKRWAFLGVIFFVFAVVAMLQFSDGFAVFLLLASTCNGIILPLLAGQSASRPGTSLVPSAFMLSVSMLLFVLVALLYYISLELPLPFGQAEIPIFVAAFVGVLAFLGIWLHSETAASTALSTSTSTALGTNVPAAENTSLLLKITGILLIFPLILIIGDTFSPPPPAPTADYPIKVMTYNLHSGFGTDGRQRIDEVADVIEASGADVVGLQEVSRGWMLDGSVDLVAWLAQRLDMPYVAFFSTVEDPLWGNAVLSRYPITQVDTGLLPEMGTLIRRGYVGATIDVDGQEPLLFMTTHLQHKADDLEAVHMAQLDVILDYWAQRPNSILVGDMNAQPGWPQIDMVLDAGFEDSWAEAGEGPGYTANAADPQHRIDWVFHTPDIQALDAEVIESQASDHFPVVVTIER